MGSLLRGFGRRRRLQWRRLGRERLGWTVRVRAAVIALFLGLALVARTVGVLPSLGPALVAAAAGTLMNLLAARRVARWEGIPAMLVWTGVGDALLITYVVAATGGTASPFLLLYVVQVLTTALVVDVTLGAAMGMGSVVLLAAAVFVRGPSAPVVLAADMVGDRWLWLSSLGATLLCSVFLGGHLTRRLARSERELASTHRRLSRSLRRLTETHASLRDAYERLARAEAELIETDRLQTLQVLVAGLAHELGNPLTVLAGNMEPLGEALAALAEADPTAADAATPPRADARIDDARREAPGLLANCVEATKRAVGLLGQLRDFGRGGRGTVRRLASLAPGLAGTLALVRYRLPAGVTVHESYADVPDVACVPAELNQVFINLVMNAIDAVAPGGHLWLSLEREGGDVLVRVRDDGAGIDPALVPHVFEPFVTTKDAGRGTGLGLAISHAIVARHHGRIEVETAAGKGTTFTVRLPVPGVHDPDGRGDAALTDAAGTF
jgi:signal transduction histidine kinase